MEESLHSLLASIDGTRLRMCAELAQKARQTGLRSGGAEPILIKMWYNCYTVRFDFDPRKSQRLRENPNRGIGFEEAQEIFVHPYYQDRRSEIPEQFRAVGWVGDRMFTLIFEVREDEEGELYHLVTLWRSTREEERLYAQNS